MKNLKLLKNPMAQGLALALGTSLLSAPYAMSQEEERVLEEVIVTGIRASLNRSADIKRYSEGVVDAISAEDIGAFPDSNLAESLQRISGVSIDRSRGEGSKVTVRGFGPEYNLVTLNGRQMPTHSDLTRSFDFADIASEGVSGVEVYKTSRAELPTGGIGATINVKTIKPLEQGERVFTLGAKAVHDTSVVEGDDVTPEISGLFSDVFADGTFGIALSGSYQDRDNAVESGKSRGWLPHRGDTQCCDWGAANAEWGAVPFNENQVNRTTENRELYSTPQNLLYIQEEFSRKRINGQLTLQWEPVENLTGTLDYTYSEVELERSFRDLSAWFIFGDSEVRSEWTDGPVAGPREYTEIYGAPLDVPYGAGFDSTKSENESIGFNLEWRATDTLTLAFDYHNSTAEVNPNSDLGSEMSLAITTARRTRASGYFDSDLPILELDLLDGRPLSPDDMLIGGSVFTNTINDMEIEQAKISGSWEFSDIANIDFGIQTTEVDNRHATSTVQRDTWGGVGEPGDISDLLSPSSLSSWFDDFSDDPRRYTQAFDWNTRALIKRAREMAARGVTVSNASTIPGDCGDGFCPSTSYTTDKRTQEDQIALYAQVDMDLEWGEMPVNLTVGVRYEETDVESQALVPVIDRIDWITSNETPTVTQVDENGVAIQDFTDLEGDYDNLLPNVDFNIEFIKDVLFRASYSKTMARPSYDDVQGGLLVGECRPNEGCTGSAGDPALEPLESDNYDLSLEWYYGEGSYAAIGYFYKDVENFIGSSFAEDVILFPELTMPTEGGLAAEARANGASTNDAIREYIFANYPNHPTVDVENQIISGGPDNNSARFLVTVPTNQEDATIDGIELAIQHTFGESGFGLIANYTYVDGDVEYDDLSTETQFALFGLSDSANLVGFYDKHGIEVRVAYNWRDEFLSGIGHDSFGAQPRYTEEYGQWDIRASYRFGADDNYTVFFEGLNVTEETWREHGRAEEDVLAASQWGARYALGFRYKF